MSRQTGNLKTDVFMVLHDLRVGNSVGAVPGRSNSMFKRYHKLCKTEQTTWYSGGI